MTLTIYGSDQSVVKTLQQSLPLGPGTTTLNFPWDGTSDAYPPGPAPKGVYLFKWKVGDTYGSGDQDTEKSTYLSITSTRSELTEDYDEATDQNTVRDGAVLTDSSLPRLDAIEAQVRVYRAQEGALGIIAGPVALPVTTNVPGEPAPVWNEATFQLAIHEEEAHLFAARDDHAARDKGHRTRWALQNNRRKLNPRADCFRYVINSGTVDEIAARILRRMGYVAYAKGAQTTPTIYELIQKDTVMFYGGGAAYDATGHGQLYGGIAGANASVLMGNRSPGVPANLNFTFKFLRDLPAGRLAGLKLAVWLACNTKVNGTGDFNTGNVTDEAVSKGATTALGFEGLITSGNLYNTWAQTFFNHLRQGSTVKEAADEAARVAKVGQDINPNYDMHRIAGDSSLRIRLQ